MSSTVGTLHGACLCGAVQFRVETPTLWCAHCHCSMCQRAHGAAFVTWVGVPEDKAWIDETRLTWFESSAGAGRGFCATCGSSLFFRSKRWPGELHITRANFSDPIDREPDGHAFFDSHVSWFTVTDTLPKGLAG
jgi:hypothetical protein